MIPHKENIGERSREFSSSVAMFAFLIIVYSDVFSGVIRYVFGNIFSAAIYIPFIVGISSWLIFSVSVFLKKRRPEFLIITFAFICVANIDLVLGRSLFEVGFGFWAWIPFLVGLMASAGVPQKKIFRHLIIALILALVGILINRFVVLPWTGKSYQVFGKVIGTTRDWDAYGVKRLSGFGRISDIVAAQIAIGCYAVMFSKIKFPIKIVTWIASFLGVYFTTSKTPIAAVAVAPVFLISANFIRASENYGDRKITYAYMLGITTTLLALVVVPPLISEWIVSSMDAQAGSGMFRARSFFDRAYYMWPASIDLVNRDGNALQPWLGRGLGGLGAPLFRAEGITITGDNMFVSLYVTFGVLSGIFVIPIIGGYGRIIRRNVDDAWVLFGIACAVLIMASTNVTIEAPYLCLCLGLVCGKFFGERPSRRKAAERPVQGNLRPKMRNYDPAGSAVEQSLS